MMRAHQGWCSAWSAGSRGRAWLAMAVLWAAMGSGPARGSTLFGLIDTGEIYASSDVGRTWSIRSTLRVRDAVAITALSSPQDLLLATRSGSIFRSSDAGVDWNQVGAVLASDVSAMAIDSHGPVLLLTASGTVHRSTNQGGSFVIIGSLTASFLVSSAPDHTGRVYALARTGEVAVSTDGGGGWTVAGSIPVPDAVAIRSAGNSLYVMTASGDAWRSLDSGVSWTLAGTLSQLNVSALTGDGTVLVAGIAEGAVSTSQDGAEWSWQGTTNQLHLVALGVDTPQPSAVPEEAPQLELALGTPWPNPRSGSADVHFPVLLLRAGAVVEIELYDGTGRMVARRDPELAAGSGLNVITRHLRPLPSGVYLAHVRAAGVHAATKWVVLR